MLMDYSLLLYARFELLIFLYKSNKNMKNLRKLVNGKKILVFLDNQGRTL